MGKKHGYILPAVINPLDTVCVPIEVPNDPNHIYAFWGALGELGRFWNWERDAFQSGEAAASVWRDTIDLARQNFGVCGMSLDCNDVENCLTTSPIILALQAQMDSNDSDIVDLQAADTSLQNQITSNNNAIIANANNITTNVNNIAQNTGDIAFNLAEINTHTGDIADHEARITALENAGGSGVSKTIRTTELIDTLVGGNDFDFTEFIIPDGFDELIIDIFGISTVNAGSGFLAMWFNDDLAAANYRSQTINGSEYNYPYIGQIPNQVDAFDEPAYANTRVRITNVFGYGRRMSWSETQYQFGDNGAINAGIYHHYWENNVAITKVRIDTSTGAFKSGSFIRVYGVRETDVLVSGGTSNLVTFDGGGYPYSLHLSNDGSIQASGNPDDCLRATNLPANDTIGIVIDLNSDKNIVGLTMDVYTSDIQDKVFIWIEDENYVPIAFFNKVIGGVASSWQSVDFASDMPVTGANIYILVTAEVLDTADLRLDNVNVITE